MDRPLWFVPGRSTPPQGLLARYRPPQPAGAVAVYVEQSTRPGDIVLALFCHGPLFLREIVQAGRRAVGVSVNLVNLLIANLGLEQPPDPTALKAAFTRLADSPKGDTLLHRHVLSLYRTRCPTCQGEGIAEWFAWERDDHAPYAKLVRCSRCEGAQRGEVDQADVEAARRIPARGLAYHNALRRLVPEGHPAHERAVELLELYTPRNLSALMDILQRLEGLEAEPSVHAALRGVLLEAFDRGSSLDPPDEARHRPRSLRLPTRYLERNVWLLMEEGLEHLLAEQAAMTPVRRAHSLAALLGDPTPAYALLPSIARRVGELLPPGSVSLILADPPRPDAVYWALCALWAGWLWDTPAAQAMRPLLRRRRFDWTWHQEVLQQALAGASVLLAPDAALVLLFADADSDMVESACLAASGAGYDLLGWGVSAGEGVRLAMRAGQPLTAPSPPTVDEVARAAAPLARACLRQRGEPTPWAVLHAAVYAGLCGSRGLLARAVAAAEEETSPPQALSGPALVAEGVRRGLGQLGLVPGAPMHELPAGAGEPPVEPLADRVEEVVWRTMRQRAAWTTDELTLAVYAALDGPLTPPLALVLLCIDSYSSREEEMLRLRAEDDPSRRGSELRVLRRDLRTLGQRLGFEVKEGRGWDVRWREGEQDAFLFVVSPTAALGRYLLYGPPVPPGARPCLVFPGGRAELLSYKLQADPRLGHAATAANWQFIKFRHVRRLLAEELNRHLFEAVLGLDPMVEQDNVQIPLILGGRT